MIRLLGFIFRLVFLIALVVWLADRPGSAQIVWRDTVIETSAAVLLVIIAAIAYAFVTLHKIWRFVVDGPYIWSLKRKIGKFDEGQKELAKGLASIAAGQASEAGKHAVKARKLLGQGPITQLLLAQSAQLAGDERTAKTIYQAMTADADVAVLGYRGLITAAMRSGHFEEATRLALLLESTKTDVPWLHLVRFEIATRVENWGQAGDFLAKARKGKALPAPVANRHEAALLLADAKIALRDSVPLRALELAERAKKLMPDWLPASLVLAEAQIITRHARAAFRTIERAWEKEPNPQLVPLAYWAMQESKPIEKLKYVERLTRGSRSSPVSLMALAEASFKAELWGEARRYLLSLVQQGAATQQAYQMLARLEQREMKNESAAASWMAKAVHAPPEPQWLCSSCGAAHQHWDATCAACGVFNRMEWGTAGRRREQLTAPRMTMMDYLS